MTDYFKNGVRVVKSQAILFLKSMSERVGSDIQRLHFSDLDFKNWMAWVWTTLNSRTLYWLEKFNKVRNCFVGAWPNFHEND